MRLTIIALLLFCIPSSSLLSEDLIQVSHTRVKPGDLFFIKIKGDSPYTLTPKPRFLTKTKDDEGNNVLIVTAEKESIEISVDSSQYVLSQKDVLIMPSFNDSNGIRSWLNSFKVVASETKTVEINLGLSKFSKQVRDLAASLPDEEILLVSRNYQVISKALESRLYVNPKEAVQDVFHLNRGRVGDSEEWNQFFKELSVLEFSGDVQTLFSEIQLGLDSSLDH